MKSRSVRYQLIRNYFTVILLMSVLTFLGLMMIEHEDTSDDEKGIFNILSAERLMRDDYRKIDDQIIQQLGGSLQVISNEYEVLYTVGQPIFEKEKITPGEFASYLVQAEMVNGKISVAYNENKDFWLVIKLPMAIKTYINVDLGSKNPQRKQTLLVIGKIVLYYLIFVVISIFLYSKMTASYFVRPLMRLCNTVKQFQEGNHSVRSNISGCKEFVELQTAFNQMAEEIQIQVIEKQKSEENRKKLMMDISHDLKNPLMSVVGYAEMIQEEKDLQVIEEYAGIIENNGLRANELVRDLFELSQMETPTFQLKCERGDFTEFFRNEMIRMLPQLEKAGLSVDIDIPEVEVLCNFDSRRMERVLSNLLFNAISYCGGKGEMRIKMEVRENDINIYFTNTIGCNLEQKNEVMKKESNLFYHIGLGLSIVMKIVSLHGGSVEIDENCEGYFKIGVTLPSG